MAHFESFPVPHHKSPQEISGDESKGSVPPEAGASIEHFADESPGNEKESAEEPKEATYGEKLAEHLTGFRPDDPRLIDQMIKDKIRIRAKYDLPPLDLLKASPSLFEEKLMAIARRYGTSVRHTSEFGSFFSEHPYANGVNDSEEKRIGVAIDRSDESRYRRSLQTLEHEVIHAMQGVLSPRMPIELQEYEAYIAANISGLEMIDSAEEQNEAIEAIFGTLIGASVRYWYNEESKKRGADVRPKWE